MFKNFFKKKLNNKDDTEGIYLKDIYDLEATATSVRLLKEDIERLKRVSSGAWNRKMRLDVSVNGVNQFVIGEVFDKDLLLKYFKREIELREEKLAFYTSHPIMIKDEYKKGE